MGKKMTLLPIELPLLLKKHDHKEKWFLYRHIQYISMSLYSKESSQTCTSGAYKHIYNYTQEDDKDCVLPSPAVIPSILLSHSQLTTGSPLFCFRTTNPQIPRLGCLSKTSVCWTFLRDLQLNCYVASRECRLRRMASVYHSNKLLFHLAGREIRQWSRLKAQTHTREILPPLSPFWTLGNNNNSSHSPGTINLTTTGSNRWQIIITLAF